MSSPRPPQIRSRRSGIAGPARPPFLAILFLFCLLAPGPPWNGAAQAQERPAVLIQQGERYLAMGKYQAALSRYAKVLECCEGSPAAAEAHNDMGVAWMRLGDANKAREHYEAALRIDRYPLALFNEARLLERRWKEHGEEADRDAAAGYYREFSDYLESGDKLPPVVEYQKDELREHLRTALRELERR